MTKNDVKVDFSFIFDPASTWQHAYQLERDLADFFAAHGLEATRVKTMEGGQSSRCFYIEKIAPLIPEIKSPIGRPKETKRILNDMRDHKMSTKERDFKRGSFVASKGYIKK